MGGTCVKESMRTRMKLERRRKNLEEGYFVRKKWNDAGRQKKAFEAWHDLMEIDRNSEATKSQLGIELNYWRIQSKINTWCTNHIERRKKRSITWWATEMKTTELWKWYRFGALVVFTWDMRWAHCCGPEQLQDSPKSFRGWCGSVVQQGLFGRSSMRRVQGKTRCIPHVHIPCEVCPRVVCHGITQLSSEDVGTILVHANKYYNHPMT